MRTRLSRKKKGHRPVETGVKERELLQKVAQANDKNAKLFAEVLMGLEETVNALARVLNDMATGKEVEMTEDGTSVDFNSYIISYREMIEKSKAMKESAPDRQVEVVSSTDAIRMEDEIEVFGGTG